MVSIKRTINSPYPEETSNQSPKTNHPFVNVSSLFNCLFPIVISRGGTGYAGRKAFFRTIRFRRSFRDRFRAILSGIFTLFATFFIIRVRINRALDASFTVCVNGI